MLKAIALFEFKSQIKRPLFWTVAFVFFLLAFGATVSDSVVIGGAIGNIHRNAPSVIFRFHLILSIIGLFITTAFVAGAALRDFEYKTYELFFSRPVPKLDYLLGRFLAGCGISFLVFLAVPLGMIIGSYMPWLDPQRLGPFMPQAYLYALFALALPNVLLAGAIFFVFACLSRSMFYTYLAVIGFFAAYSISLALVRDIDTRQIAAYLDPFGIAAFSNLSRYWTVVDSNTIIPPLSGLLLYNRLLWLGFAASVFIFGLWRFRITQPATRRSQKAKRQGLEKPVSESAPSPTRPMPACTREFGFKTAFQQFTNQARIDVSSVFKSIPFPIILLFGLLNLIGGLFSANLIYGTNSWPVTHLMILSIKRSYLFLLLIIVTFYSGELIWRERSARLTEVTDSTPTPNWAFLGGKLFAQLVVVCSFLFASVLTTMIFQLATGYTHLEPAVYFEGFIEMSMTFLLVCFLTTFLQVVSGKKFVGYLLTIVFLVLTSVLESLHFDHNLYRFASAPEAPFSDMNGYGHFVKPLFWFNLYWAFAAAVLAAATSLLWIRGTDRSWKTRLALVKARYQGPVKLIMPAFIAAFVLTGAFIFYNTNVLNEYVPSDLQRRRQADYERNFRQYKDVDLPRVQEVYADVDIFPYERRVDIRGRYLIANKNNAPIEEIHMSIPHRVKVNRLDLPACTEKINDKISGYRIYRLAKPMLPGEETTIRFNLAVDNPGFQNNGSDTSIVYNGTFFNNRQYFPSFGYIEDFELKDENDRRKEHLPPYHRMAKVDDLFARRNNGLASDSDWIKFETTVSTSADQIALAPGYLQGEWIQGNRRYFHYRMDAPILHFYSYLSARYEVLRDKWRDVNIEIYYHKPHAFNLSRMVEGIKKSLDYYSANFGPYQHRQVRILEFPRYGQFAQSFPNTIPYSESIGFIARIDKDKENAIDFPFYVTAHEVAHQWWAHQVIGGNVQGSALMSESFSQYSALMVMEKEYGKEKMRRFLKYELDRYLSGRGGELIDEMPLQLVESQPYVYYNKGSVVTYALRDYIGESLLNRALSTYLEMYKYQQPPYTNSLEFMNVLSSVVPTDKQALLDDMFRTITLFENRAEKATCLRRPDGKYVVSLQATAKKFRASGKGVETEIPMNDWIDIGIFAKERKNSKTDPKVLYVKKHLITTNDVNLEIVVDEKPTRAGIDPYNKLVDRKSDDNEIEVKE